MKTALLLIDIQNDYFEDGLMTCVNAENASLNAKTILDKFRIENKPVIHIQHIATRSGATFFLPYSTGAKIHANVQPLESEKVITKHFPNSFIETSLLGYIKSQQITDLVICGMMTHMCVDATTRAAKDLGLTCTVIGDACATRDLEIDGEKVKAKDVHHAFLAALNNTYATVIDTEKYLK